MEYISLGDFGVFVYHYSGIQVCNISVWGYQLVVYQFRISVVGYISLCVSVWGYQFEVYQFGGL